MSSGDNMAPFMASEMAWFCHVSTFMCCYISKTYSTIFSLDTQRNLHALLFYLVDFFMFYMKL